MGAFHLIDLEAQRTLLRADRFLTAEQIQGPDWQVDPEVTNGVGRWMMLGAGLSEETARAFEDNGAMSLTLQTALLDSLEQLESVTGREHSISLAIEVESREAARTLVASPGLREGLQPLGCDVRNRWEISAAEGP